MLVMLVEMLDIEVLHLEVPVAGSWRWSEMCWKYMCWCCWLMLLEVEHAVVLGVVQVRLEVLVLEMLGAD